MGTAGVAPMATMSSTSIGDNDSQAAKWALVRASLAEFKKFDMLKFSSKSDDP